jgi:hypothetical protein
MRRKTAFAFASLASLAVGCGGPAEAPEGVRGALPSIEPAPLDPDAPAQEKAALAACGPVTTEGYCGVLFGMSPAQAARKFPVKLDGYDGADADVRSDPNHCFEMFAVEPVQGVSFLVEMNRIGRVDFMTEAARTIDGFGVGSTPEEITARFGAAVSEGPNKYEPEVRDLTVTQGLAKYVFEIQDAKVRGWRAGIAPTIDYTEHCG